ncbi:Pantoate--beta-alanine ligase (EC [uncultured Gammaproteobacteria bacterium]|nr:Pantoate--beta-alanine ligase (EC [uncultured Gammaproteobacteria bacterium]
MEIISNISEMKQWRDKGERIAFVPTMGGLHQGHLSLIDLAKKNADKVVVSIFVNPTQFAEHEDFGTYPRTMDADLVALEVSQTDLVFTPNVYDIYPDNTVLNQDEFTQDKGLFETLCGKTRPHFFYGVLQVVRRLFEIIHPDVAVFGQKDYQQLHIIKHFTSGVKIIGAPIVREHDGLAMSTRNQYLNADEHKIASKLHKILKQIEQGELELQSARERLQRYFELDYLELLDANTLKKITDNTSKIAILSAVYLNKVRLIDNIIFSKDNYV